MKIHKFVDTPSGRQGYVIALTRRHDQDGADVLHIGVALTAWYPLEQLALSTEVEGAVIQP